MASGTSVDTLDDGAAAGSYSSLLKKQNTLSLHFIVFHCIRSSLCRRRQQNEDYMLKDVAKIVNYIMAYAPNF